MTVYTAFEPFKPSQVATETAAGKLPLDIDGAMDAIDKLDIVYWNEIYNQSEAEADADRVIASNRILCTDFEYSTPNAASQHFRYGYAPYNEADRGASTELTYEENDVDQEDCCNYLDWVHAQQSSCLAGFYGMPNNTYDFNAPDVTWKTQTYWLSNLRLFNYRTSTTPPDEGRYEQGILQKVDILYPQAYAPPGTTLAQWKDHQEMQLAFCRRFFPDVTVLPFLWRKYSDGSAELPSDEWVEHLEWCVRNADGCIVWDSRADGVKGPYNQDQPWCQAVLDAIALEQSITSVTLLTSQNEMEQLFGEEAILWRADDDESGVITSGVETEGLDDAMEQAHDEVLMYLGGRYNTSALLEHRWARRAATIYAVYYLSRRRGNAEQYFSAYLRTAGTLKSILKGHKSLPRMTTAQDDLPAMSNIVIDDRYQRAKAREQTEISEGSRDGSQDTDTPLIIE